MFLQIPHLCLREDVPQDHKLCTKVHSKVATQSSSDEAHHVSSVSTASTHGNKSQTSVTVAYNAPIRSLKSLKIILLPIPLLLLYIISFLNTLDLPHLLICPPQPLLPLLLFKGIHSPHNGFSSMYVLTVEVGIVV